MIRIATAADIPRIVELGSESLIDGPYKGLVKNNPKQTTKLAETVIQSESGRVMLYEDDQGKVVGLLAFLIAPQIFTGEPTATELMWFVEPASRHDGAGIKLLWAAEEMARALGAKYMGVTSPTEAVSALYSRFGYHKLEISYLKILRPH